ncbi:MAG: alkylation response protein AidB-like acyl-CoA dehydrogenase [Myxococcota bacterium]|jgi:alkylation response protein AidB-like acyl-CoA dehydrogenase
MKLDAKTLAWQARCAAFAKAEIAPVVAKFDQENRFPDTVHDAAHLAGILGSDLPARLGGGGQSDVASVVGAEALAAVCAPIAFTLGFNRGALHPILTHGTPAQQQRLIGDLIAARRYAALCLTEPDVSGSNLMGLRTTATKTPTGWVISGDKAMVGNGGIASLFLVLARTVIDGSTRGLTFFAVPRGPGVTVGENTDKLGFRAVETPTVGFRDVATPDNNRIGAVGSGAALLMETLDTIRVGGAAVILGIVVGALSDALPWIEGRQVYGGPLAGKSHIQLTLGGLYSRLELCRGMVLTAARRRSAGLPYGHEAGIAKLESAKLAVEATSEISQMFGWRGIDGRYAISKRLRDARQTTIFEGTSEVQKLNLFHTLLSRHRQGGI